MKPQHITTEPTTEQPIVLSSEPAMELATESTGSPLRPPSRSPLRINNGARHGATTLVLSLQFTHAPTPHR